MLMEIGSVVNYATSGVGTVTAVKEITVAGKKRSYYELSLVLRDATSVMIPIDNEVLVSTMRPLLSREELEGMLSKASTAEFTWNENDAIRQKEFQDILKNGHQSDVFALYSKLCAVRKELREKGRHLKNSDNVLLATAEKLILGEICYTFSLSRSEAESRLKAALDK